MLISKWKKITQAASGMFSQYKNIIFCSKSQLQDPFYEVFCIKIQTQSLFSSLKSPDDSKHNIKISNQ
jgi:hypothetical protein